MRRDIVVGNPIDADLPAVVFAFLEESGAQVLTSPDGTARVGSGEVVHTVRRQDDRYVVDSRIRGRLRPERLESGELATVARYLVLLHGPDWRQRAGLRHLLPALPSRNAAQASWTDLGDGRVTLTWAERRGRGVARELVDVDAAEFALMLDHRMEDVVASYRDPSGRPVFPQGGEAP